MDSIAIRSTRSGQPTASAYAVFDPQSWPAPTISVPAVAEVMTPAEYVMTAGASDLYEITSGHRDRAGGRAPHHGIEGNVSARPAVRRAGMNIGEEGGDAMAAIASPFAWGGTDDCVTAKWNSNDPRRGTAMDGAHDRFTTGG